MEQSFKGFRSRWIERATPACDAEEGQADKGISDYSPSLNLGNPFDPSEDNFSDLMKEDGQHDGHTHSLASFEVIADRDSGSTCSKTAAEVMTTNAFVRNVNWTSLVLPWENDFMSQIFSESSTPDPKLSLPNQWNATVVTSSPSKPEVSVPSVPSASVYAKHVRQMKEETFWEQRQKNSKHAVAKWILFLKSDLTVRLESRLRMMWMPQRT